jgi:transcriptional regulator with XRE-family HTH domain
MPRRKADIGVDAELVRTNLVRFREEIGLSQADVADRASMKVDTLRRYEQGTRQMDAVTMRHLASALGHLVDHFFLKEPPPYDEALVPRVMYRLAPGMKLDEDLERRVREAVESVNREQVERLKKGKRRG